MAQDGYRQDAGMALKKDPLRRVFVFLRMATSDRGCLRLYIQPATVQKTS